LFLECPPSQALHLARKAHLKVVVGLTQSIDNTMKQSATTRRMVRVPEQSLKIP
jgi:hypothetical protein